jgi:hypothetical protein
VAHFAFVSGSETFCIFRARRRPQVLPSYRLAVELLSFGIVALTGHLGGF